MKVTSHQRWLAFLTAICLALPATTFATNGYFLIGYGAKSRGMGGVGVAYAQDALAAASNPAGMADVDFNTMRIDVGADLFIPPRAVHLEATTLNNFPCTPDPSNPTKCSTADLESGMNVFLIPNMGGIFRFNRKLTMGMAVVGAGLGTRYNQEVPGAPTCHDGDTSGGPNSYFFNFQCLGSTTVGVMLMQMQMLPSVAYKVTKTQTVGASLAIAVQTFRAYGLQAFSDPQLGFAAVGAQNLTNKGNAWSYGGGIRLGWLGKFFDQKLRLGANWSSRVYMSKFYKYRDLFAEGGDFDIPTNYALGMSIAATPKINVAFDVERVAWSSIKSVGNPGPLASNPQQYLSPSCYPSVGVVDPECLLGGDRGLGFGWEDRTIYKLGVDYKYDDKLTLRTGLNYSKTPIPNDQVLFNLLAPATVEKHFTLGASYAVSDNLDISASWVHAFKETIKGPTIFNGGIVQGSNASAAMYQDAVGASIGYKF